MLFDPTGTRLRSTARLTLTLLSRAADCERRIALSKGPKRTSPARTYARLEFIHATAFCTWLAEHGHRPTALAQVDLDRYYTALKIGHRQSWRGS
jgi:hypothetical protein